MFRVRKVKTGSGKTAVQVVSYIRRKTKIVKHIGSAQSVYKIYDLEDKARDFISKISDQTTLFDVPRYTSFSTIDSQYGLLYKSLEQRYGEMFPTLSDKLFKNLTIARIVFPTSKRKSVKMLKRCFGITYHLRYVYRKLPDLLKLKSKVEKSLVDQAKEKLNFDFSVVLYDVTTLYFESFDPDDLRKIGFSKDNKFNQPQILLGLIVTKEGFPVSYQVFEGNKFEGHTLIPSIVDFREENSVEQLTVIADAAMISSKNIKKLKDNGLNFIVGARLKSMSAEIIEKIATELSGCKDGATIRIKVGEEFLVCQFSQKRYQKDKKDLEKSVAKAKASLNRPSKILGRYKFVKKKAGSDNYELNISLIEKTKKLLGMKGYVTNLKDWSNSQIVKKYASLWQVEKSFRITKSDLCARPVFHRQKESIQAHILICFAALGVSKLIEIDTGMSIKRVVEKLKTVVDSKIRINHTEEIINARGEITPKISTILKSLHLSH